MCGSRYERYMVDIKREWRECVQVGVNWTEW